MKRGRGHRGDGREHGEESFVPDVSARAGGWGLVRSGPRGCPARDTTREPKAHPVRHAPAESGRQAIARFRSCRGMEGGMLPPCAGVERFQTEVDASASRHPHFLVAAGLRPRPSSSLLRGRRRGEVRASTATARTATVGRKHLRAYRAMDQPAMMRGTRGPCGWPVRSFVAGGRRLQPASNRRERRRPRLATANSASARETGIPKKKGLDKSRPRRRSTRLHRLHQNFRRTLK